MRGAQPVLLDLRIEPRDDLARLDEFADIDGPLDHATVEAARGIPGSNHRGGRALVPRTRFGSVSMDELAEAAGVARRTLYNQFASKEDIFREMLLRVSAQLEHAFPPGIETQGDVEEVLRLVARIILQLHQHPAYLGFLRMVTADSRQFPWIAEEFAAVMEREPERLVRYLAHLTATGVLDCRNPLVAAHHFMGLLNEFCLWPWMLGREPIPVPHEEIIEETVRMFLRYYRPAPASKPARRHGHQSAA